MTNNAIRFCIIELENRFMLAKEIVTLTKTSHILIKKLYMVIPCTENTGHEVSGLELYRDRSKILSEFLNFITTETFTTHYGIEKY